MLLSQLLSGIDYICFGIFRDIEITRPFSDSRRAVEGGLFICHEGALACGEDYIPEALVGGAAAVVSQKNQRGVPTVVVGDTRYAAAVIWNNFYNSPAAGMRLFAVTGTNGKTSVAAFLSSCLRFSGKRVGTVGTLGSFAMDERLEVEECEHGGVEAAMTTPDPEFLYGTLSQMKVRGVTDVVMEVSSHGIVRKKTDALSFSMGIFTNLSPEHLDFHPTMEDYFRAKASLVARCPVRLVNGDDPYGRRFAKRIPSVTVSVADVLDPVVSTDGVSYRLGSGKEELRIKSSVGGEFTIFNTLIAARAALLSGVSHSAVEDGISAVKTVKGRLERLSLGEGMDAIIDYAHTPAALEKVLYHLRRTCRGRVFCLFGCGGDRDRKKRPVMGKIAESLADCVVVTSDNPRTEEPKQIIDDILEGMERKNHIVIADRKKAIFFAISMMERGDVLLLAGKGHETYEIGPEGKRDFDERMVVREALRLKYGK